MKKNSKDTLIEIIGAIVLLALIGGIVICNKVCSYDPPSNSNNAVLDNNIALSH